MRSLDVFSLYQESQHKQCFLAFLENQERQGSPYLDEMVEKYLRAIHSSLAILVQEIWLIFHPF